MPDQLRSLIVELIDSFLEFFPQLLVGLALLVCGWGLAWFVKRLVVHLAAILKLDHFLIRSRWKAAFEKADVRYGFYNFLGNIAAVIVFLIFLDFALLSWDLKILSDALGEVIFIFPRFLAAVLIFSLGWIVAHWATDGLLKGLHPYNLPYAAVIAHYAQIMLLVLFAAMALIELDVAREVVLIGFTTLIVMLAAIAIILAALAGKHYLPAPNKQRRGVKDQTSDDEE